MYLFNELVVSISLNVLVVCTNCIYSFYVLVMCVCFSYMCIS